MTAIKAVGVAVWVVQHCAATMYAVSYPIYPKEAMRLPLETEAEKLWEKAGIIGASN
jgi:hypothetical protein